MKVRSGALAVATLMLSSCDRLGGSPPIRITGSSTVYPFSKLVADAFVRKDAKAKPPIIESVGTGEGVKIFCKSSNSDAPDILNASRRLTRAEFAACQANDVAQIVEIPIGIDGIAVAESVDGPKLSLTTQDIYLALAANPKGKPNAAKTWSEVNPKLPALPILVLGPPKSSGTHDSFANLILRSGCLAATPEVAAIERSDAAKFSTACLTLRTDGNYAEQGENDNSIVTALAANPKALGVFGYSYLEQNAAKLRGVPINDIAPTAETIASGKYPGFRTLYLYVKKPSLKNKPSVVSFLKTYAEMWAPGGPLVKNGLIPLSDRSRKSAAENIDVQTAISGDDLP